MRLGDCKHFNGFASDKCRAGIEYEAVHSASARAADRSYHLCFPCFNAKLACPPRVFPTAEEVQAATAAAAERLARTLKARAAIEDLTRGARGVSGFTICPNCGGTLSYGVSRHNGHFSANCTTPGCVGFMD